LEKVNLFEFTASLEEQNAVLDVLRSGWITQGPKVKEFEDLFSQMMGSDCVAVNSCTAALHLAHVICGAGPEKEVIVPSLTFVATPNSVSYTGAEVVFADIKSLDDWTLDSADVKSKITSKTCGVSPMHFAGFPTDIKDFVEICDRNSLYLVEDACHGLGSSIDGKQLGTLGDIGCFSFYGNKIMTTAEGGMMVFKNPDHAAIARSLRSHGMTNLAWDRIKGALSYDVMGAGYNYRMDDIRAALGIVQLKKLDAFIKRRKEIVTEYKERLANVDNIIVPSFSGKENQANYIFPILLKSGSRDKFRADLYERGIQTSVHYAPSHMFSLYKSDVNKLPVTEFVAEKCLSLPLYPSMTSKDVNLVCEKVSECAGKA
jgi:dTDP-4-amino-4,6-dideoxygalactose transaminase